MIDLGFKNNVEWSRQEKHPKILILGKTIECDINMDDPTFCCINPKFLKD